MSQENVERAQRFYAALNDAYKSGNVNDLRPLAEDLWDPEIVLRPSGRLPEIGEWHGHVAHMIEMHEGRATRIDMYTSKEEALEAVGLSTLTPTPDPGTGEARDPRPSMSRRRTLTAGSVGGYGRFV